MVSIERGGNWKEWWDEWEPESVEQVVREKFEALV